MLFYSKSYLEYQKRHKLMYKWYFWCVHSRNACYYTDSESGYIDIYGQLLH